MQLLLDEGLSRRALFVRKRGDVADELASAEKVLSHSLLPELVSAVLLDLSGRSLHEANQAIEFARRYRLIIENCRSPYFSELPAGAGPRPMACSMATASSRLAAYHTLQHLLWTQTCPPEARTGSSSSYVRGPPQH